MINYLFIVATIKQRETSFLLNNFKDLKIYVMGGKGTNGERENFWGQG